MVEGCFQFNSGGSPPSAGSQLFFLRRNIIGTPGRVVASWLPGPDTRSLCRPVDLDGSRYVAWICRSRKIQFNGFGELRTYFDLEPSMIERVVDRMLAEFSA